jgi:hypothetical protein
MSLQSNNTQNIKQGTKLLLTHFRKYVRVLKVSGLKKGKRKLGHESYQDVAQPADLIESAGPDEAFHC